MDKLETIKATLNSFFNPDVAALKPVKIEGVDEAWVASMDNDSTFSVWFTDDGYLRVRIHGGKTVRSEVIWGSDVALVAA